MIYILHVWWNVMLTTSSDGYIPVNFLAANVLIVGLRGSKYCNIRVVDWVNGLELWNVTIKGKSSYEYFMKLDSALLVP